LGGSSLDQLFRIGVGVEGFSGNWPIADWPGDHCKAGRRRDRQEIASGRDRGEGAAQDDRRSRGKCSEKNLDSLVHRRVRSDSRGRAIVSSAVPILHLESEEVHGAPDEGARKQKNKKDPSSVMNAEVRRREEGRGGSRRSGSCACSESRDRREGGRSTDESRAVNGGIARRGKAGCHVMYLLPRWTCCCQPYSEPAYALSLHSATRSPSVNCRRRNEVHTVCVRRSTHFRCHEECQENAKTFSSKPGEVEWGSTFEAVGRSEL
jgi:hypothetical protein